MNKAELLSEEIVVHSWNLGKVTAAAIFDARVRSLSARVAVQFVLSKQVTSRNRQ